MIADTRDIDDQPIRTEAVNPTLELSNHDSREPRPVTASCVGIRKEQVKNAPESWPAFALRGDAHGRWQWPVRQSNLPNSTPPAAAALSPYASPDPSPRVLLR